MKRILKPVLSGLLILILLLAGLAGVAHWRFEQALQQRYEVNDPALAIPNDPERLAHGAHLFNSRGCSECHGAQGQGQVVLDEAPLRVVATNLTPAGRGRHYDADTFARAIRHSIAFDGRPLVHMPSRDYAELSDADTAALVAHLQRLAPSGNDPGDTEVHLLGRLLHLFGQLPVVEAAHIDHRPRTRAEPEPGRTVAFGGYVARTCIGCHGEYFRGGKVPGTPPDFPPASDLTAMPGWREADFVRLMREGKRPDGSEVHLLMPWQAFKAMTDEELGAMFLYFRSL